MQPTRLFGTAMALLGLVGYTVGVAVAYPGRAFSVAAVMLGATLVAIGGGGE